MLSSAGDLETGKQMLDAALKLDPDDEAAWGYLGMIYRRMQRYQESAAAYDHAASFESFSAGYLADAAYARAKSGDPTEARRLLVLLNERMERRQWFPAEAMAMTQAALGNEAEAREWLRRAVEDRSVTVFELNHEPFSSEMRCRGIFERDTNHQKNYCSRKCIQADATARWRANQRKEAKKQGGEKNAKG